MPRVLSPNEKKCIGCGLCVIKSSLIEGSTIDLGKAFIRIYGRPKSYIISVDYGKKTDFKDIVKICPRNCFEIIEK
ncbi:hypothetical protein COT69_01980 [candidate division WWE3 bacterium CG09_land_8_20_14_0_10_39_24]|uniref:4Fe-4S ferredoxin-type domain-containing protein n=2 Tax=Katanobacteria TaxID=422282 RepID=A0A2G9XBH3_UNCKA|nr:MAG: hypothetical protein AUJ94_01285 [bacterium CG2_30_40_12]OJI08806.1 MAG: hypothetical protein BK003_01955 [bacterium CG09_39_24]PIP04328.1 MAG: hypothetical protein COX53_03155 [candidate division WWE3 bacterium CG23_combo_of_CG06-09_8_20_14_all_40_14]PIS12833.1 MAG: hypothetical protein COT69_01980 [candidate division WWE3 bacterium CG09_land_8_20_14_0_10_39_24]PJE50604.1 MAG: hypothetical protein COV27_02895 [candidate division WWE3 bacterium CG10_big_fil_rev_8_21_14_0_10_39_14]